MNDHDQLRVQIYSNLSLALIAAAFTTLAGTVGAFALSAEKLSRGYNFVAISSTVVVTCVCLILSIYFGGRGIKAIHDTLVSKPANLPKDYDKGNFNLQAVTGLLGLFLGALAFFFIGLWSVEIQPLIQQVQTKVNTLDERIGRFEDAQQQLSAKVFTSVQDIQTKVNLLEERTNHLEDIIKHLQ